MTRLLYLVSHPIQYQAPLLRRIAAEAGLALRVIFGEATAGAHREPDFGLDVAWDVPLLDSYEWAALDSIDLRREIAGSDAVWIHGWQYPWQRRALHLAQRRGVPVLMRGENWAAAMPDPPAPLGWAKRAWRRSLFGRVAAFLTIGSRNRDYYIDHGIAADRLFSMPYAVDNRRFAAGAESSVLQRETLRAELGLPAAGPVVLFAGKLMPRKRPDLLITAWKRAPWSGPPPALVFAGDGVLRPALQQQAPEAIFTGFRNQSQLPALYALADLLVVPSEREPWGLVVNEAMASGTAVIASDEVGAAHDLITAESGALFRSGDADGLAAALAACLPRAGVLGEGAARAIARWDFEADIRGLKAALEAVA